MIWNWETHGFHHFYDPITDFCIIFKAMICRNTVRLRWTKLFFLFFWFLDRCPSHSWRNQLTTARKLSFLKCFWLNTHEKTRFLHNILLQKYPCVVYISCTIHCKRDIIFLNAREKRRTREMAEKIFFGLFFWFPDLPEPASVRNFGATLTWDRLCSSCAWIYPHHRTVESPWCQMKHFPLF